MSLEQKHIDELVAQLSDQAKPMVKKEIDTTLETKGFITADKVTDIISKHEPKLDVKSIMIGEGADAKSLYDTLREQGNQITQLQKKSVKPSSEDNSLAMQFKSVTSGENKGKWDAFIAKQSPFVLETKAVQTNTRSTVPTAPSSFLPEQEVRSGYIPYRTNEPLMFSTGATISRTNNGVINWVDETAGEGDAGWTEEGTAKPNMDVNATVRSTTVQKVAVTQKVSEEALADIDFLQGLIEGRMRNKLALKVDDGLINGDGTSFTPTGITYYAPAFTSTAMNGTVTDPNKFDALSAAATQIELANFSANRVYINPADWYSMMHTKDLDNDYVLLNLQLQNGNFMGIQAVKSNQIPAGSFLMGDFRYFNIAIRETERFEAGWENDDFTKNLRTFRLEMRLASYVSENEKLAFCYDTYADVENAIVNVGA